MTGEWKPGDVALVTLKGLDESSRLPSAVHIAMRDNVGSWASGTTTARQIEDGTIHSARRLVVIDPWASRSIAIEIAQRVCSALHVMPGRDISAGIEAAQAVIREFARPTPPPKPEEPTGEHAVVLDEDGSKWVRRYNDWCLFSCGPNHHKPGPGTSRAWRGVPAVRVLFEGLSE